MLRNVRLHLIISTLGILIGISAFFVFFVAYGNHDVGFWSVLSAALAGICFHLHWVKGKESLDKWHSRVTLRNLNIVGFLCAVAGITAMIWYIFLTCYYKIPVMPIAESTVISAVWAMISGKWGILVTYYTNKYTLLIQEGATPILTENSA